MFSGPWLEVNNGKGVAAGTQLLGAARMGMKKLGKKKGGTKTGLGDVDMGDDTAGPREATVTPEGVRALVEEVLASNDFVNMRSSKMTQDDFLLLLATFNEKGIHFA